jgi:hypothetical protein
MADTYLGNTLINNDSSKTIAYIKQLKDDTIKNYINNLNDTDKGRVPSAIKNAAGVFQQTLNNFFLQGWLDFQRFLLDEGVDPTIIDSWKEVQDFLEGLPDDQARWLESTIARLDNRITAVDIPDGGAYDVSADHVDGEGNYAVYADLRAALAAVPNEKQKPGMSIRFIQGDNVQSSDNKYVQSRYMGTSTANADFTNVANWQGVDEEPTAGSDNLAKSGGVEKYLAKNKTDVNNPDGTLGFININGTITSNNDYTIVRPILLKVGETILLNKGENTYLGYLAAVIFKTDSDGNWQENLITRDNYPVTTTKVSFTNTTNADMYIGTCTYNNQRSYTIVSLEEAASKQSIADFLAIHGNPLSQADARTVNDNIKSASLFNFGSAIMIAADNPSSSAAKVIAKDGFVFDDKTILVVRLYPSNTADELTLNINNTGAKNLYYNGARADSANCWSEDELAILTTNGTNYYLTSTTALSRKEIRSLVSNLGVTTNPTQNVFLKELYLTGLDSNTTYYLAYIIKNEGGAWSFAIRKQGDSNEVAVGRLEASAEKVAFVEVTARNSSGINGYAVVDWSQYGFGSVQYSYTYGTIRKVMASELTFNPTIYAYLKDAELQASLNTTIQQTSSDLKAEIHEVKGMIGWNSVGLDVYSIAQNIKEERSYFLNEAYANEISYADTSYLDGKLRNIPEGKHFIFTTDSHIDYYNVNLSQRETEIMAYVKAKLNAGCVVFGGDAIGQQDTPYKAAKVLSVYAEDKFNAFGPDFLWCQGNHDANANTNSANRISSEEIYKRTTGVMKRYGKAVFDTEGISIINGLGITTAEMTEAIAWMNLHYYYNDDRNKIRFIVLESGDGSLGLATVYTNHAWDGYTALIGYITFVANAVKNTPNGYDIVVVIHQMTAENKISSEAVASPAGSMGNLYGLLAAYKQRTSFKISENTTDVTESGTPILYALMHNRIGSSGITYDFSENTPGRVFMLSGHFHFDDAWVIQNSVNPAYLSRYYGKEYGEWDTVLNNAILSIQLDRACLYGQSSWVSPESANHSKAPNAVSFANQDNSAEAGTDGERVGTVKEVLFDVVTITPDNKVVCTRIGAGSDREYNIPMVSA